MEYSSATLNMHGERTSYKEPSGTNQKINWKNHRTPAKQPEILLARLTSMQFTNFNKLKR